MLQSQLATQATELAAAQAELAGAGQRLADAQAAADAREAALRQQWAAEREAAAAAAADLQGRLDALAQFQAQRDAMSAEMQRLRADNAYIAQEAGDKVRWCYDDVGGDVGGARRLAVWRRWEALSACLKNAPVAAAYALQVRALQVRLRELEHKRGSANHGSGGDQEGEGGEGASEAELTRLLAHSRRAAAEIQQFGKVGGAVVDSSPRLHSATIASMLPSDLVPRRACCTCLPTAPTMPTTGGGGAAARDGSAGGRACRAAARRSAARRNGAGLCQARHAAGVARSGRLKAGGGFAVLLPRAVLPAARCPPLPATQPRSLWCSPRCQAREIRSAHTKISSLEKGLVRGWEVGGPALRAGPGWPCSKGSSARPAPHTLTPAPTPAPLRQVRMAADFEAEKAALEAGLRSRLDAALAENASLRRWAGAWAGRRA